VIESGNSFSLSQALFQILCQSQGAINNGRGIADGCSSIATGFAFLQKTFQVLNSSSIYSSVPQGVFDIAHLLYGDQLFYDLADETEAGWVDELMEVCLGLYVRVSRHLKTVLGEETTSMIHGHATPQGVYFPHAGVRISEDTATLLSPEMIERFVMPLVERSVHPFGGGFVHFCGHHPTFFELLCRSDSVRAIDLGNPETYDTCWLLKRCAETRTVLYSRLAAESEETWDKYVRRIAGVVRETGARCILRPTVFPTTGGECANMLDLWHTLTV